MVSGCQMHVDDTMEEIDERIKNLIAAINKLPHIFTTASCGGHENPSECQVNGDEFTVTITIDYLNNKAWKSVEVLTFCASKAVIDWMDTKELSDIEHEDYFNSVRLCGCYLGALDSKHCDDAFFLSLHGKNNFPPDLLADTINKEIEYQDKKKWGWRK